MLLATRLPIIMSGLLNYLNSKDMFIPRFPFFSFKKRHSPNEYLKVKLHDISKDNKFKDLIQRNRELLSLNNVPINKIRFVPQPSFQYDVEKDVINPTYEVFIPLRKDGSGLFDNKAPVVELNKPLKLIMINVSSYRVEDNYAFLRILAKKSKRGLAVFIVDEEFMNFQTGTKDQYYFSVGTPELRFADLDAEVLKYQTYYEPLENQTV